MAEGMYNVAKEDYDEKGMYSADKHSSQLNSSLNNTLNASGLKEMGSYDNTKNFSNTLDHSALKHMQLNLAEEDSESKSSQLNKDHVVDQSVNLKWKSLISIRAPIINWVNTFIQYI